MAYNDADNALALHLPSFVCAHAPTLAPGGGAEVIPASLLSDNPLLHSWFSNNGFSIDHQYPPDEQPHRDSARAPQSYLSAPFDFDSGLSSASISNASSSSQLRPLTQSEISALLVPHPTSSLLRQPFFPLSGLAAPSPLNLPVYSASGFDLLSIMARVANRPHPRVVLGPVDMTCSFVVVDVRRYDHPIVYCSPSFCHLTGYTENQVLGRNCRFLQAPNGHVQRGEARLYTEPAAVAHLKKNLSADKECQTSIINYKKDGTAFVNLVTVIPIAGGVLGGLHEESDVVYHVGFQVDLTEQPNAILEKLRDGSYIVDYASHSPTPTQQPRHVPLMNLTQTRDRKTQVIPSLRISRDLKKLLSDPAFVKSIPISSSTTLSLPQSSSTTRPESSLSTVGTNQLFHLMLLEALPDFILVVSLKGSFLYVAPSVRRVLGYEPEEMVGQSISDFAHPEDVVPLMRELKEGSATGLAAAFTDASEPNLAPVSDQTPTGMQITPRTVDLLFRARTKHGAYVWIECKGRLHVEPGKGRKAIVLSGRAKEMPRLKWQSIAYGGGLTIPTESEDSETEVWGMMSNGQSSGGVVSFTVVGSAMVRILGWNPLELVGRQVVEFIADGASDFLGEIRELCNANAGEGPRRVCCKMRHKNGNLVNTILVLFRPSCDPFTQSIKGVIQAPLIYQLRSIQSYESNLPTSLAHSLTSDVFDVLDTSRDTSWQYELQQIRFANQRLGEEISSMKKQFEDAKGVEHKVLQDLQQRHDVQQDHFEVHPDPSSTQFDYHSYMSSRQPEPTPPLETHPIHHHPQGYNNAGSFMPQPEMMVSSGSPMTFSRGWDASSLYFQNQNKHDSRGLKRSWDVARCG
ncbi:hypothetical protein Agabi119p4_7955 [Agaricus bisporus var. burnettii]|uniref:PAS domain-containing protein n=1 Tax=Agaricus bisporus var. burnettii TaxID=192524 RepID=A0A8H7C734_AGABI|nr:hypothetical protein Agabi119p4_7955 [Agaricus bisporus var. burnettii]